MIRHNRQPTTVTRTLVRLGLGASAAFLTAACAPPLLSPNEPRSQFDRYDAVRNQRPEQKVSDDYGTMRPNLQERLTPRQ